MFVLFNKPQVLLYYLVPGGRLVYFILFLLTWSVKYSSKKKKKRVNQCLNPITFKFVNNTCSYYLKYIFEFAKHCRIDTRNKYAKLKIPFRKTNMGQRAISFVSPSLWNSLPELIKKTNKHNVKKYCLNWLNNKLKNEYPAVTILRT